MLNGGRQTDAVERSLCELEFNDLNFHLYLSLNYGTASEHLKYSALKLYGAFIIFVCLFMGLNNNRIVYAQYRIWIGLV